MAPKQQRVIVQKGGSRGGDPKGAIANVYDTLTSSENASVVKSVLIFGGAIAIFSSSLSELLLPPL
ncbi:hypothetical protein BJ878DRAFT_569137 [Calycina marina]|uniref:TOM core complex subunit Tom6 n=1 Tax=Calycina marina TaxID=1763456 RepID=A0A9P8CDE5_9HELO|nr:hypothetical protein BJ878DRAFT_569137 [Calycina marina]